MQTRGYSSGVRRQNRPGSRLLRHAPVVVNIASVRRRSNGAPLTRPSPRPVTHYGRQRMQNPAPENRNRSRRDPVINRRERESPSSGTVRTHPPPPPVANQITKTRLIDQPVRSGQRIYAPHCDLIVTNHVSAGAELIADGNIHVYGMMRGRALAGAGGDRDAQIFCTHLAAELVSIAGEYWLSDNIPAEFYGKAARLRLGESALTVQPLN